MKRCKEKGARWQTGYLIGGMVVRMVYLYIAAWILCMAGIVLHKNYVFCIGSHMLKDTYNRKFAALMETVLLLLVFLLLTANRTGLDIINYEKAYLYEHEAFEVKDKLYGILSMAAYQADFSFYMFRAILTFLSGVLAVGTMKKIGTDFSFILLFYLPSMLFVDSMQFRNAVCLALFLWSLRYLLFEEKYAEAKFIICILLIAQMHAVYYFALILSVFFIKNKRKQIAALLFLFSALLAVVTALNGNQIPFFSVIANLFLSKTDLRGSSYYTSGNLGWIVPTVIHMMTTLLCVAVNRYADRKHPGLTKYQREYLELILVYDLALFVTVPAIMMNLHYYRLVRGAFMMNVIGVSFLFQRKGKRDRFSCGALAALAVLALMWYVMDLIIFENSTTMAIPVLDGKLFFLK